MADTFRGTARFENMPSQALWDLTRVAVEIARSHFRRRVRGAWILNLSGSTANDRTYYRKAVATLREAMEGSGAAPQSMHATLNPTIGTSKVYLVMWYAHWGTYPSGELWVTGRDRIAVEDFLAEVVKTIQSHAAVRSSAPDLTTAVGEVRVSSFDRRGSGEVHTGLWRWIGGIATAVIAGLIIAVVSYLLKLN